MFSDLTPALLLSQRRAVYPDALIRSIKNALPVLAGKASGLRRGWRNNLLSKHDHFLGLFALRPLHQFILHHLSFIQSLEAVHLDRGVVDEHVSTAFRLFD